MYYIYIYIYICMYVCIYIYIYTYAKILLGLPLAAGGELLAHEAVDGGEATMHLSKIYGRFSN